MREREIHDATRPGQASRSSHSAGRQRLEPLDNGDVGRAAALAHRLQSVAAAGALQLVEHGGEQLGPGGTQGVAKGAGGTLFLETDDCQAAYDELSARGVTFNDPPTPQAYGIDTSFRDPSGNNIRLTEVLEFDPARGA